MKFGRRAPKSLGPHLKLARYLTQRLPEPQPCDYSATALPSLRDVMANDAYGDCVFASANHVQGVVTGNAGALVHASVAQVLAQYSAVTGFDPKNPATDQGADEVTALNWYCANGFANGVKPLGWIYVDATNLVEVRTASWLFEHVIWCAGLPDAWITPFPSSDGYVWGAGSPNPNNGHSFMSFGCDASGNALIDSWGLFGKLPTAAQAGCCTTATGGGAYCILTPEMVTKGQTKAPNGIAWSDLVADFDQLGGSVPIPTPVAPPLPPAPPGSIVTLDQAVSWARAALEAAHPLLTRTQAEAIVEAALSSNWTKP
jgi:hypothetical protein